MFVCGIEFSQQYLPKMFILDYMVSLEMTSLVSVGGAQTSFQSRFKIISGNAEVIHIVNRFGVLERTTFIYLTKCL